MPMNHRTMRPYRKSPAGTPASLLLRFDGNFDDSSSNGLTATAYGNADTSADESKFGGSSLVLDGSSYLTVSDATAFAFGTEDFTAECWIYVDQDANTNQYLWDMGANYAQCQILNAFGYSGILFVTPGNSVVGGTTSIASNAWHHFAVVRKSGTTTAYLDGVSIGSDADASDYSVTTLRLGQYGGGGNGLYGYIDDFRVVKGLAVYDGAFTPSAGPLSSIARPVS